MELCHYPAYGKSLPDVTTKTQIRPLNYAKAMLVIEKPDFDVYESNLWPSVSVILLMTHIHNK